MKHKESNISPNGVADFLIVECRDRGEVLTNLKLQKLLYYAQAWFLASKDRAIFEEDFHAWIHGPVLLSQYHRFKHSEWRPILDEITTSQMEEELNSHLIEVVDVFGVETAGALERMTLFEEPWRKARGNLALDASSNDVITKISIQEYYKSVP